MRIARFTQIALSLALLPALACSDVAAPRVVLPTAPPSSTPAAPSPPPQVSAIILQPANAVVTVGDRYTIWGYVQTSIPEARWEGTIVWSSSDIRIAYVESVGETAASVVGLRPGSVSINATVVGRTISTTLTVLGAAAPGEDVPVVVDDFHVIEFQYPSAPGHWFYAPQLRLHDTTGVADAAVIRMAFEIPGFGGPSPACTTNRLVASTPVDVFREMYGDYEFTIDKPGARATAGMATAIITLRVGKSAIMLTASGPVVPGSLPTTYTGGSGVGCG